MKSLQFVLVFLVCRADSATVEDVLSGFLSEAGCARLVMLGNNSNLGHEEVLNHGIGNFVYDGNSCIDKIVTSKEAGCLIGISGSDQFAALHESLLHRYNRRLVMITHKEVSPAIHKHHQPALVIQMAEGHVLAKYACHSGKPHLINLFKENRWLRPMNKHSCKDYDRVCHKGNHPLANKNFVVSAYSTIPFLVFNQEGSEITGGVAFDTMNTLAEYFNFEWTPKIVISWSSFGKDGTVGGSLGEVVNGNADFCLEMYVTPFSGFGQTSRFMYYHFSSFLELAPKQLPVYANIFRPLDSASWLAFIVTLLLVSLTLHLHARFRKSKEADSRSLLKFFLMTFGIVFQEYQEEKHVYNKQNIFVVLRLLWIVTSMLLTSAYSGNLMSNLIKKRYAGKTLTLNEMIDKDLTLHMSESLFHYLENTASRDNLHQRMVAQIKKKNSLYQISGTNAHEAITDLLLSKGGTVVMYVRTAQAMSRAYLGQGKPVPFVIIPQWYQQSPMALFFQKYDPRAAYFDEPIARLTDSGIIEKYFRRQTPIANIKEQSTESSKEDKLVFEHFVFPVIFGISGLAAGLVVFAFELKFKTNSWENTLSMEERQRDIEGKNTLSVEKRQRDIEGID